MCALPLTRRSSDLLGRLLSTAQNELTPSPPPLKMPVSTNNRYNITGVLCIKKSENIPSNQSCSSLCPTITAMIIKFIQISILVAWSFTLRKFKFGSKYEGVHIPPKSATTQQ